MKFKSKTPSLAPPPPPPPPKKKKKKETDCLLAFFIISPKARLYEQNDKNIVYIFS
jgi:hypothetical protein